MLRKPGDDIALGRLLRQRVGKDLVHQPERLYKVLKRRIDHRRLPQPAAMLRLGGAVQVQAHDEWQVADERYLSEGSVATLTTPPPRQRR